MTSSPPSVWPSNAAPPPPASTPPATPGRAGTVAALVAVGLFGAVVGFAGGRFLDQPPNLSGSLSGIAASLRVPSAASAGSTNAAPPSASANPAPPAASTNP